MATRFFERLGQALAQRGHAVHRVNFNGGDRAFWRLPGAVDFCGRAEEWPEFLDRLISIALPRIRDFRGVNPKSFDGNGNYSLGLSEQMVFPEIDPDKVTFTQGMDITFVTSTRNDDEARELLRAFGMPFREA